ncbi:Gfo/Idh/MocA family oxidoreductase [Streptomyces sp. CA2R106]|uniref:Gfo/Idh/MocA family oxidoreductase n=1 Tax=Streptomyces sp. CA2R106 TaxID=3120153 RepID=UPI0030094F07
MRIGIVGTESSHVDHIVHHLNVEALGGDARVVALSGGASERNELLCAKGGLERIVEVPTDLLGLVDAVMVTDRDGALHRAHAVPFLEQGLPVFVDKPLACDIADAEAIIAAARAHDAPLTSYSALRALPDTDALAAETAAHGGAEVVAVSGPADPQGPYGGVFFYGIHAVDTALRLAPGPLGDIHVARTPTTLTATTTAGTTRVVVTLVRPTETAQIPFHAMAATRTHLTQRTLTLGDHYLLPGLRTFLHMARTRQLPLSYDALLHPIHLLHELARTPGAPTPRLPK